MVKEWTFDTKIRAEHALDHMLAHRKVDGYEDPEDVESEDESPIRERSDGMWCIEEIIGAEEEYEAEEYFE